MKGFENDHYCCQVVLQFQGFDINLIYMKNKFRNHQFSTFRYYLSLAYPFCGMPFHVDRTLHIFGIEPARFAPLIKL
jgi:hypothetical protein